jgi:uncharacterized protein
MKKISALYSKILMEHAKLAWFLVAIVLVTLAWKTPNFRMDASADSLVLESDRSLQYYRTIKERYGSDDFLVITFTPQQEIFQRDTLNVLASIANDLKQIDGITGVTNLLTVPMLNADGIDLYNMSDKIRYLSDTQVDLTAAKNHVAQSPLYQDMLLSRDGKTTAMQVDLFIDHEYEDLLAQVNKLRAAKVNNTLSPEDHKLLESVTLKYRDAGQRISDRHTKIVADVRNVIDQYRQHGQLYLGGIPMIASDIMNYIGSDLSIFGIAIVIFLVAMLAFLFRKRRWIVIPMLCCVATVIAMFGFLGWMNWPVTVISSNFVSLLLVITMSINIHLIVRFNEFLAAQPNDSLKKLVVKTVKAMAEPCFYTTITTVVAFASLAISGIRPVIDFGLMMTFGMSIAFLLCFIIFPLCVLVVKKPEVSEVNTERFSGLTQLFANLTANYGGTVMIMGILLAAFSVTGTLRLEVDNRFIDYFKESTEIYQGMKTIDTELGGTTPFDIVIDKGGLQGFKPVPKASKASEVIKPELLESTKPQDTPLPDDFIDEFAEDEFVDEFAEDDFIEGEDPFKNIQTQQAPDPATIHWPDYEQFKQLADIHNFVDSLGETGKVLSLHTTIGVSEQVNRGEIDNFTLQVLPKLVPEDARKQMIDPYFDQDDGQIRIGIRMIESNPDLKRQIFLEDLRKSLVEDYNVADDKLHFTGMLILYNNMLQSLFQSQIMTLGAVFLAITFMFAVLFRSLYLAVLTIIPNLVSAGAILGVMGWFGIPLDLMTITIAAITIGIAVDDSVHYVVRFKNEFPLVKNYKETMFRCHKTIGQAMYYTTMTIAVGFSILALSNFIPSIYFGLFTGLAMIIALVANLTLLPRLFMTFKPLGKEQA